MRRAMIVALALAALAAACGDADDATTTTTSAAVTTTTSMVATTTTEAAAPAIAGAEATTRRWIAAIAAGDDAAAIALTAPRSLEAIGGPDGFADREIELAEGWGAWDSAEYLELFAVDLPPDRREGTAVVVLHGIVAQEGPPEERWSAIPVVATDDGTRVEPFLDLGQVEADPPSDSELPPSPTLTAYVLGNRDVAFVVDGGEPVEPDVEGADGDQQKATYPYDGTLEQGVHGFTVVVWNDDGVMARTFTYSVEG